MSSSTDPTNKSVSAGDRRQELLQSLLHAAKACQNKYAQKSELATDANEDVRNLISKLELVFQHGLRSVRSSIGLVVLKNVKDLVSGSSSDSGGMWRVVRTVLNKHELERFSKLQNIMNDLGRGRAWLRCALNEQSLEKYLNMLLGDEMRVREFYEDWAFLRDQERSSLLLSLISSLCSIKFALKIDAPDMNGEETASLGTLTSFLPTSLKPSLEAAPVDHSLQNSLAGVAEETKAEIIIDTNRPKAKKKKKHKGYVAPINENVQTEIQAAQDTDTIKSPFDKTNSDADNLTSKLNNIFGKIGPSESSNEEAVDFTIDSVDLTDNTSQSRKGYHGNDEYDFYSKNFSEPVVQSKSVKDVKSNQSSNTALTPVANKGIGNLIPINSKFAILQEDVNNSGSGDDTLSDKSVALDETDYGSLATTSKQERIEQLKTKNDDNASLNSARSSSSLKRDDLKSALLSVMEKKDELEDQIKAVKKLLDQEINHVAETKQELNDMKQIHKEKLDKVEARNTILSRENELLKHQLKKYVGAVQKLRDGPDAYETLAKLEGVAKENEGGKYIDYHFEASEYEKKLIQVAEMHGELLEFNENLQKNIQNKDTVISRLKDELISLRGPLPDDDDRITDDSASICSSFTDPGSISSSNRVLVNIWIPSVFLTGAGSSRHHVYQVYIRIRDVEWNIYKRYSQFYNLHSSLKKKDPIVNSFEFPPKKSLGNKSERFVEDRRRCLQTYLRSIVNYLVSTNVGLSGQSLDKETLLTFLPFFDDTNPDSVVQPVSLTSSSQVSTGSRSIGSRGSNQSIFRRSQSEQHVAPYIL